jgi:hypothetical protein
VPTLKDLGVSALSITRALPTMRLERVDGIINAALSILAQTARADMPGVDLVIRDLLPDDFPGLTTNVYAETTTTGAAGYLTTTAGNGGAIADETFIAIWGCRLVTPQASETTATTFQALVPPITGLRITVGASVVAIWDFYRSMTALVNDMAESQAFVPILLLTEMPIIIRQNQTLKIEEYNATTAADPYELSYEGAVCEKAGKNIAT